MGTFSSTWHPLWVEFDGSPPESFTRGKGGPSVSPKVYPFHVVQELKGLHLTQRKTCLPQETPLGPGFVTGLVCTQGREGTLGSPSAPVLSSCSWHIGKSKGISLSFTSSCAFLLHHLKNRLARWVENDSSLVLGQVWCWMYFVTSVTW